jgi:hypothetical protein
MIHLLWETTASPERDAASPAGDAVSAERDSLASPNFGICDTTLRLKTDAEENEAIIFRSSKIVLGDNNSERNLSDFSDLLSFFNFHL